MSDTPDIQRQYDEIIAESYDRDPQSVLGDSRARALTQLRQAGALDAGTEPLRVLDIGMGTGRFLEALREQAARDVQPHGLDLSAQMVAKAQARMPELVAEIDDAANLDAHFREGGFDLVGTHFVTGFVPIEQLAEGIFARLRPGGLWSFVGGTRGGFPELERRGDRRFFRWLFGAQDFSIADVTTNPEDEADVVARLERFGFELLRSEIFEPRLHFPDFEAFMDFGYRAGWLTPIIEAIGLHRAGPIARALLNRMVFPVEDRHRIVIALARRPD